MKNCYLCVFSDVVIPTPDKSQELSEFLNKHPEFADWIRWFAQIPNAWIVASDKSASDLTTALLKFTKKRGTFIVVRITERNGWLNEDIWEFISKYSP